VVNVRGHQFVEIRYHTPSNCDVCNKTLPWSINIIGKGECAYECKRELKEKESALARVSLTSNGVQSDIQPTGIHLSVLDPVTC